METTPSRSPSFPGKFGGRQHVVHSANETSQASMTLLIVELVSTAGARNSLKRRELLLIAGQHHDCGLDFSNANDVDCDGLPSRSGSLALDMLVGSAQVHSPRRPSSARPVRCSSPVLYFR